MENQFGFNSFYINYLITEALMKIGRTFVFRLIIIILYIILFLLYGYMWLKHFMRYFKKLHFRKCLPVEPSYLRYNTIIGLIQAQETALVISLYYQCVTFQFFCLFNRMVECHYIVFPTHDYLLPSIRFCLSTIG